MVGVISCLSLDGKVVIIWAMAAAMVGAMSIGFWVLCCFWQISWRSCLSSSNLVFSVSIVLVKLSLLSKGYFSSLQISFFLRHKRVGHGHAILHILDFHSSQNTHFRGVHFAIVQHARITHYLFQLRDFQL